MVQHLHLMGKTCLSAQIEWETALPYAKAGAEFSVSDKPGNICPQLTSFSNTNVFRFKQICTERDREREMNLLS